MTMISTSQARLVPPRAKYMDSASMQEPSTLGSHSVITIDQQCHGQEIRL